MPTNVGGVYLDTTKLQKITNDIKPNASRVVRIYGNNVTSTAIRLAPVDTGNLINTIAAESKMIDDLTYRVQDGTAYGRRIELGFHDTDALGRIYHQAAHPFLVPALEQWRNKFVKAFGEIFK